MLNLVRGMLIEKKDAISSFMSKEMPISIATNAAKIYEVVNREMRTMEMHNLSQLAKYGTKNDAKYSYEMLPDNPNFQTFMKERNEFLHSAVSIPLDPIGLDQLEMLNIRMKPFEIAELMNVGIIVEDAIKNVPLMKKYVERVESSMKPELVTNDAIKKVVSGDAKPLEQALKEINSNLKTEFMKNEVENNENLVKDPQLINFPSNQPQ